MFQTLALQQLGKLINPITGKLERDLQQARITIDMLQMLRVKTSGNLTEDERRLLENVIVELQMNFVDESNREKAEAEKSGDSEKEEDEGGGIESDPEKTRPETAVSREENGEKEAKSKKKSKKKSSKSGE